MVKNKIIVAAASIQENTVCLHTSNLCIFNFNKFKFLNKDNECALKAMFVITRKAQYYWRI